MRAVDGSAEVKCIPGFQEGDARFHEVEAGVQRWIIYIYIHTWVGDPLPNSKSWGWNQPGIGEEG